MVEHGGESTSIDQFVGPVRRPSGGERELNSGADQPIAKQ